MTPEEKSRLVDYFPRSDANPDLDSIFRHGNNDSHYSPALYCHYWPSSCYLNNVSNSSDVTDDVFDRNYWTLVLLLFPVLTVFGNVLVVLSVFRERSLRTVTNYFIVSLAIADIMVAILVMPISVYVEVNNAVWELGDAFCDTWVAFDVMCCTASILNLTAISIDRFIAVTQPIKYAKHKNSNRVYVMLAMTWVVSVTISSPIALGMNYTERRAQTPNLCIFYNSDFLIYSSMGSFYIPCLVMVFLYWRIFRVIRLRARKAASQNRAKSTQQRVPTVAVLTDDHRTVLTVHDRRADRPEVGCGARQVVTTTTTSEGEGTDTELIPLRNTKVRVAFVRSKRSSVNAETSFVRGRDHNNCASKTDDTDLDDPPCNRHTVHGGKGEEGSTYSTEDSGQTPVEVNVHYNSTGYSSPILTTRAIRKSSISSSSLTPGVVDSTPSTSRPARAVRNTVSDASSAVGRRKEHRRFVTRFNFNFKPAGNAGNQSKKFKEKSATRRERKATKTLAIVLGVFLFCWVPFFTINIINAVCIRYDLFEENLVCQIDPILFSFFVWLGYINSFLNPLIYTIFNIEFRRAFKKLLTSCLLRT